MGSTDSISYDLIKTTFIIMKKILSNEYFYKKKYIFFSFKYY